MMRKTLPLVIALAWAACFIVQATILPQHPVLGAQAVGMIAAAFGTVASAGVAGLFLWLVACLLSERGHKLLLPFGDWLRITFAGAVLVSACGIVAVVPSMHAHLAAIGFLQLAALSGSYVVMSRELRQPERPSAANDNVPLGTRLLAWNAARNAMYDRMPIDRMMVRGERRR
ncbi:MAG: hypothetical protein ACXIVF_19775 [Rhizobiaceae bacterium]